VPTEFADHQRKAMLRAIQEREGRWDEVDPDTEVARIGKEIGLSEDQSYELFGHLVDEGFVDPGRAYQAGGAMPGSISRVVGREENMTVIGDDVRLRGSVNRRVANVTTVGQEAIQSFGELSGKKSSQPIDGSS
jgi:hypothetical protein